MTGGRPSENKMSILEFKLDENNKTYHLQVKTAVVIYLEWYSKLKGQIQMKRKFM